MPEVKVQKAEVRSQAGGQGSNTKASKIQCLKGHRPDPEAEGFKVRGRSTTMAPPVSDVFYFQPEAYPTLGPLTIGLWLPAFDFFAFGLTPSTSAPWLPAQRPLALGLRPFGPSDRLASWWW